MSAPTLQEVMEAPPECFICTDSEPAPRRSACKCTDRYVHTECLAKMLATARHSRCPVCAAPYTNVKSRVVVVGVDACSRGAAVLGAAMCAVGLIGCGINTWWVFCCSTRELSAREDFVVCFSAILMTSVGFALVAFVGKECVATGPRSLARSMLVRMRRVRVADNNLPGEVALPPRIDVSELGLAEQPTR